MQLLLVRHAIAVERTPNGGDDESRALTGEGSKKMRHHAKVLRQVQVSIEEIWTSPLVRARQTAELLAAGLECQARVRVVDALAPDGAPEAVLSELGRRASIKGAALVGHEPYLSEMARQLLTARRADIVEFKKGGVASFEVDDFAAPLQARLQWLLTPRMMALMM